jgi:hypothetical protein
MPMDHSLIGQVSLRWDEKWDLFEYQKEVMDHENNDSASPILWGGECTDV